MQLPNMGTPISTALIAPGPISHVRVTLTSRCNLRCVYCAVSQANYREIDMSDEVLSIALESIKGLSHYHRLEPIDMNGHGETTMNPGWIEPCITLLHQGIPIRLTTNLAKNYNRDELEVLASMSEIVVSIDTSDMGLLRRMRRKVDIRQIVTNIQMIRATAMRLYRKPPGVQFHCGLYDKNSLLMEDFARFAVSMGVAVVSFWSLTPYPYEHTDVSLSDQVKPLDDLADDELVPRVLAIRRALGILKRHGISTSIQADFVERLARRVGLDDRAN